MKAEELAGPGLNRALEAMLFMKFEKQALVRQEQKQKDSFGSSYNNAGR